MSTEAGTSQKKLIITIAMAALITATLVVAGAVIISNLSFGQSYEERLSQAQLHLDSGDYSAAILVYEQAIQENQDDPEGYLGLADALLNTDQIERGLDILRKGLALTGSDRIKWLLEEFERLAAERSSSGSSSSSGAADQSSSSESAADQSSANEQGNVQGKVTDASTGRGVASATIEVRQGGSLTGRAINSVVSDRSGNYSIQLDRGDYWITVSKRGYTKENFRVQVSDSGRKQTEDFVISSELALGQIRIVLTWDAQPRDLDAHLVGSLDDGSRIDVSFNRKKAYDASGAVAVDLDVDDRDGNGPETMTIHNPNGSFEFYVNDFTNSGTMSNSHAQVKIYVGANAPTVVDVPPGIRNNWSVCRIDHGRVSVTNTAR